MADITMTTPGTLDLSNEANTDGNSNNTNDTIVGSAGDDTITAGASTEQTYIVNPTAPVDHQHTGVVEDNDTIVEASGTNTLTGGYGHDQFVFNIDFSEQTTLHTETYGVPAPTQLSGANTNGVWNSYVSNLNEWRADLAAQHGVDEQQSSTVVDYTYSSGKTVKSGEVSYDNTYAWTETTTHTNTSTNTITDWGQGGDSDKIVLAGITQADFDNHNGTVVYDGVNTTIHIGTFSITVLGANVSESDLTFQASAWA